MLVEWNIARIDVDVWGYYAQMNRGGMPVPVSFEHPCWGPGAPDGDERPTSCKLKFSIQLFCAPLPAGWVGGQVDWIVQSSARPSKYLQNGVVDPWCDRLSWILGGFKIIYLWGVIFVVMFWGKCALYCSSALQSLCQSEKGLPHTHTP